LGEADELANGHIVAFDRRGNETPQVAVQLTHIE
jgi:hypothetical protein